MRSLSRPKGRVLAMVATTAATLVTGCGGLFDPGCVTGAEQQIPVCQTGGAVSLSAPAGFAPSGPPTVILGRSCLAESGCTGSPVFNVSTYGSAASVSPDDFTVEIRLSAPPAPAELTLPTQQWVMVSGLLNGGNRLLHAVGGTINVNKANESEEIVVFDITLATDSGLEINLKGKAEVTDCHLESHCSF